jgi:site-specific DNA recombinase
VTHAAVYLRQSFDRNDDQLAVARQREDCVALCERRGWTWTEYEDNDYSATDGKPRPAYQRMVGDIRSRAVNGIVAWHVDRLYRQPRDLEDLIDLANVHNIPLATVSGDIDLSTDMGRLVARLVGATNKAEVERKSARQKRANQQARAAGRWNRTGLRKFGYDHNGVPFEPEASALRQAADDVLAGRSLRGIAMDWNNRGFTTTRGNAFTSLQLRRTLINPLYAALVTYQDKVVGPGEWQAIVDEDTHLGLVAYLSDPSRRPVVSFERRHMLSGVAVCGICGERLRATYPGGKRRPMTYACRSGYHLARLGAPLDEYVEMVVLKALRDSDTHLLLRDGRKVDVGDLHTRRAALQARLDDLAAMFAEGAIDGSQLRRGTSELRTQLAGIDNQLAELARRNPVADLLADGQDAVEERWAASSPDMKGKIVNELMNVTVLPTPRGVKGVSIDRATGVRIINPDYIDITRREAAQ